VAQDCSPAYVVLKSVLYLGCPASDRAETEKILATADLAVVWADGAASALNELQRREMPVLFDLSRGAAALETARELRTHRASTPMFAVVDSQRPELTTEAVVAGMADVFARPLGGRRVANAIEREIAYRSHQPRRGADLGVDDLYSHSAAMRDVMALIARAATMGAGVLIRGEEGTGRRVAARAIHAARGGGKFVSVDCAAFEGDRLDTELFGTVTRSQNDKSPRGFERVSRNSRLYDALGGAIYLQHVADAPWRAQARFARLLRDREAVLVETGATVGFEVRPMAGVDPAFHTAVQEGRVREDLYRRLSVIQIDMPALKSRREDIPALANFFLRDICASLRLAPKRLSRPALSLIAALPWRGNAGELRTLLEGVVTSPAGGRDAADVKDAGDVRIDDVLAHVRLDGGEVAFASAGTLRQARARFEREYIARVLKQHRGHVSEAATALGIQRTNLYRKMRSLGVNHKREAVS
jgi:two-component system, NtrC family, nitrogen regulation response regulator NtrX